MDPFTVISLKSFDSVWYWIMMGVAWSMMCHWTLGVPFDGLVKAQRKGGEFASMVDELAGIYARRATYYTTRSGVYIFGIASFFLAIIFTFGFFYGYELAQACFVLVVPLLFVQFLNVRLAHRVLEQGLAGEILQKTLLRRRFWNQVIGLSSIVVAAGVALVNFASQIVWY